MAVYAVLSFKQFVYPQIRLEAASVAVVIRCEWKAVCGMGVAIYLALLTCGPSAGRL